MPLSVTLGKHGLRGDWSLSFMEIPEQREALKSRIRSLRASLRVFLILTVIVDFAKLRVTVSI